MPRWDCRVCGTDTVYPTAAAVTNGTGNIWSLWVQNAAAVGYSAAITSASTVWPRWVEYHDTIVREAVAAGRVDRRVVSEEERARWREQERALEAQAAEMSARRRAASERAEELLQSILTPQQRDDLKRAGRFFLHTGGKRYRVDRGQHGNVKLVDDKDQVLESYCVQPRGGLPDADAMAAQVLTLETNPAAFLSVANVSDRNGRLIRMGVGG